MESGHSSSFTKKFMYKEVDKDKAPLHHRKIAKIKDLYFVE